MTYAKTLNFSALALFLSSPVHADILHNDDVIIGARLLCVGPGCIEGEAQIAGRAGLKFKDVHPFIFFDDLSPTGLPTTDWLLDINGDVAGEDFLRITDLTNGTEPFLISANAPDNSFFLRSGGNLGLGTSLPISELHIVASDATASIRLEEVAGLEGQWAMGASDANYFVQDIISGTFPLVIAGGATNFALKIEGNGYIGLGTEAPDAPLELSQDESFNFFRITATGAAVNESVDITFTGGPLGTGQLRYNIVDGDNQEMSLDADGNMVIDGTLTTGGPECAGGCDRVFDTDYPLRSIADRTALIAHTGYLPALGPTVPHAPINVTEKLAGVINELEHAHLYIGQLHSTVAEMQSEMAAMRAQIRDMQPQD